MSQTFVFRDSRNSRRADSFADSSITNLQTTEPKEESVMTKPTATSSISFTNEEFQTNKNSILAFLGFNFTPLGSNIGFYEGINHILEAYVRKYVKTGECESINGLIEVTNHTEACKLTLHLPDGSHGFYIWEAGKMFNKQSILMCSFRTEDAAKLLCPETNDQKGKHTMPNHLPLEYVNGQLQTSYDSIRNYLTRHIDDKTQRSLNAILERCNCFVKEYGTVLFSVAIHDLRHVNGKLRINFMTALGASSYVVYYDEVKDFTVLDSEVAWSGMFVTPEKTCSNTQPKEGSIMSIVTETKQTEADMNDQANTAELNVVEPIEAIEGCLSFTAPFNDFIKNLTDGTDVREVITDQAGMDELTALTTITHFTLLLQSVQPIFSEEGRYKATLAKTKELGIFKFIIEEIATGWSMSALLGKTGVKATPQNKTVEQNMQTTITNTADSVEGTDATVATELAKLAEIVQQPAKNFPFRFRLQDYDEALGQFDPLVEYICKNSAHDYCLPMLAKIIDYLDVGLETEFLQRDNLAVLTAKDGSQFLLTIYTNTTMIDCGITHEHMYINQTPLSKVKARYSK